MAFNSTNKIYLLLGLATFVLLGSVCSAPPKQSSEVVAESALSSRKGPGQNATTTPIKPRSSSSGPKNNTSTLTSAGVIKTSSPITRVQDQHSPHTDNNQQHEHFPLRAHGAENGNVSGGSEEITVGTHLIMTNSKSPNVKSGRPSLAFSSSVPSDHPLFTQKNQEEGEQQQQQGKKKLPSSVTTN